MPVHVLDAGTQVIQGLQNFKRVSLREVEEGFSLQNKYVKGLLERDHGLKYINNVARRKVILKEGNILDSNMINVFLVGSYARDLKVSLGDEVFIAHASVHKSPTYSLDLYHRCMLVVEEQCKPDIWIVPKPLTTSAHDTRAPRATAGQAQTNTANGVGQRPIMNNIPNYHYTPLKDLVNTSKVDVYGVVKFFKPPFKTTGPDYVMTLTIIDPSIDPHTWALSCVLFHPEKGALPKVYAVGDIVRLHRLKIITYNGELQGQKGLGFACVTFDGRKDAPFEPRASTANFTITDRDKAKVKELQDWAQTTSLFLEQRDYSLIEVIEDKYFDLTCQIIAKAHIPHENCVLLRVWDGTKCPLNFRRCQLDNSQLVTDEAVTRKASHLSVDIFLYDDHVKSTSELQPGNFVRLFNLHSPTYKPQPGESCVDGTVEFVLHHGTSYGRGLTQLQPTNHDVRKIMRRMENPVAPPPNDVASSSSGPSTNQSGAPTTSTNRHQFAPQPSGSSSSSSRPNLVTKAPDKPRKLPTEPNDDLRMTLQKVTACQYFDWTCQVIATASMPENHCVCLKVWDGTKCKLKHRQIDCSHCCVSMKPMLQTQAGDSAVDVCIYDNHVPDAEKIKPGDVITLFNLHAAKYPPGSQSTSTQDIMVEFALHRGSSYNRHVLVLKESDTEAQVLNRRLDTITGKNTDSTDRSDAGSTHKPSEQQTSTVSRSQNSHHQSGLANQNEGLQSSNKSSNYVQTDFSGVHSGGKSGSGSELDIPSDFDEWEENLLRGQSQQEEEQRLRCMQRSASYVDGHRHIQFKPISDVLSTEEPSKFKIRAKVVDYLPKDFRDWVHLYCLTCKLRCAIPVSNKQITRSAPSSDDHTKTSGVSSSRDYRQSPRRSPRKHAPAKDSEAGKELPHPRREGLRRKGGPGACPDSDSSSQESSTSEKASRKRLYSGSESPVKSRLRKRTNQNGSEESVATAETENHPTASSPQEMESLIRNPSILSATGSVDGQIFTVFQADDNPGQSSNLNQTAEGEKRCCIILENATTSQLITGEGLRLIHQPKVRLVNISASDATEKSIFICPRCRKDGKQQGHKKGEMKFQFQGHLHLDDGSGKIEAILQGDKAVQFFNGLQPTNLHKDHARREQLQDIIINLCPQPTEATEGAITGNNNEDANWLECCVMSYLSKENRKSYKYQIFDTKLVDV